MVCASHELPQEACYSETYQVFKERHLVPFQALEGLLQLPWRLTGAGLSCVTLINLFPCSETVLIIVLQRCQFPRHPLLILDSFLSGLFFIFKNILKHNMHNIKFTYFYYSFFSKFP